MTSQSINQRTLNISTRGGSSNRGGRRSNQSTTLTADQRHQIEAVQSVKPEWEKEQVTAFCEEHNYNGDAIQSAIAQLFEFDRPAHAAETEEWKTIPSQQRKAEGSPTNAARVAGRGARGGRGGSTRGGATLSDRSINAQSVTNDQKFARGQPSGRGRDNRGSSPTNEDDADKKKYKKVEKPTVAQVQLPVAGKSYAASLGLAKQPAAPVAQPVKETKSDETSKSETVQSKPVVDTPAAVAPIESTPQQQTAQPEATPPPAAVPAVQPAKTAAQIVAAGPKKPAPKQSVAAPAPASAAAAAPAPTPIAAPVSTPAPAVVSEEKNDEPKVASQSAPSPSSTTTTAAKPAVSAGRMWRKKESSTSSPANAAVTASSPPPIAAAAEPVAEQPSVSSFATAPLASLSQSIQAALKPASPQVRPASPQQAPKSPAHVPAAIEKIHAPAPSSSPVRQSVADLLSAHDAVILPQHLRTVDADVQFGFGGKSTGPRAGGPRAPQPKAAPQVQPQAQQPASPALNAHSQSALGSFPQTVNAGRFPGSTSPLIHGLSSAATEQSKAVSSARPAGVAGLTPSTPQNNLPLQSQNQTPQTQASMDSSVHGDEYGSLQNQPDLHSNDYSQHNESHHDETGLANNLAHLSTSAGSYTEGDPQYNYLGNMDALSSPPAGYDPIAMGGGYGYDQFQMGNEYSMYSGYGDYNQNNMGFQQRGMGGPNKRGGFMPQNRGQVSQSYGNYRGPQQNYQQQSINKPQSNMPQQPKKYQQPGPGAIQQPQQQQQQQPNAAIGRPPVNQTAKSPQPNTVQPQNQAPQQMMNTARPMQSQSPNPTQYNDYSRQSYNKQNNAPVGQQQYQANQNAQPAYNAQPKAPHSPQSYKPHQGPNKSYNKPNQYPQQQQYNNNAPNYNQAPFNPLQNYHPYGYPQYPAYANQFPVGGVPAGPPGFNAGRGYPGTSGVQGFAAPFHGQSGYSSPQNFGGEYDLQSNVNDPYAKQQFSGHVGDQSLVDPSQAQSGSAQSMGDASAWQSNQNQPKKAVGPESDPAAQRLGPYQNLPFNQQGSSPYNHSMSFGAAPQQHQPLYSNPQQYQPPQQQPQQHYQQQQPWQPHM